MNEKKSRFILIFLCILALLVWRVSPLLAQQASPQPAAGVQSFGSFEDGFTPTSPADVYNPWPNTQGVTVPQGPRALQPPVGGPNSVPQKGSGDTTSLQPADAAKPQRVRPLPEPLSSIEAAFVELTNEAGSVRKKVRTPASTAESPQGLRQFGYSLFASSPSTFAPIQNVPVGPDYILGPGDTLDIKVWGAMESGVTRIVDQNGTIYLPTVGPLRVWGLAFSQAERLIRDQLSRYFRGFQSSISMAHLRTIAVYVIGKARQPGSYSISSLSTLINTLFAAGGPTRLGSLRRIELKRNHHTVGTLDLYDFLLRGDKSRDFRVESGDIIFIPPIGPVAAIEGEVKEPAIYELNGPTRLTDLIEMAGGLTPRSYLKRVQVIRAKPNAEREVIDLDLTAIQRDGDAPVNIELQDGDFVRIYPADPRIYNTINLAGAVKHPGVHEFKPNMRISQILPPGSLLSEAYQERVEVVRFKEDLTTEVIHVNLKQVWGSDQAQDISLRPRDRITVRSEFQGDESVTIQGQVKLPGTYTIKPGERLSSVLRRAGGFTEKAYLKGAVFTRETVQDMEKRRLDNFVRDHEQRLLSEASQLTATAIGLSAEQVSVQQAVLVQRQEQLRVLASKVTLGRVVINLDDLDKLEGSSNDLVLEDGDSLKVPQKPATVLVMGSVRNPTGILHKEDQDIQYYLNRAGGITPEADAKGLYLLKADGSAITGFMRLRDIEPGDAVIVPPSTEAKMQWLSFLKDAATIAGQVALGLAGLVAIAR